MQYEDDIIDPQNYGDYNQQVNDFNNQYVPSNLNQNQRDIYNNNNDNINNELKPKDSFKDSDIGRKFFYF